MEENGRYQGTIQYIYAHWPSFALMYGGIIIMLLVIGLSVELGLLGFVPLATAVLIFLSYFLITSLWTTHQLYSQNGLQPHLALFQSGNLAPIDNIVYVDVGIRFRPIQLCRRLTTGELIVIDVYNPQWTTNRALARWRTRWQHPPKDPRLVWMDGQVNLLPLPDQSVSAVILCQVTSEFWQHGDRSTLLAEARRILKADGRLLIAERCRTQTNMLMAGPAALALPPVSYWRGLISETGFRLRAEKTSNGLIHTFYAQKPTPTEARQLAFDLGDQ